MCEALRELMKEDLEAALEKGEQNMIIKGLKNNRTAEEVAEFLGIPLEEVEAVEKNLLQKQKDEQETEDECFG